MRPISTEIEAVLVDRARSGDRLAFEELIRRNAERLYAVVLRFVANEEEAEEVTQDAFLRAWGGIGRFEGRAGFFTWLYRIGINEAKRRAGRRAADEQPARLDAEEVADAPDWSEAPPARFEQAELRDTLEVAIRSLPLPYRAPIILRDVEGLSTSEAAAAMELSEPAFKSRLHRARLSVRASLDLYFLEQEQ